MNFLEDLRSLLDKADESQDALLSLLKCAVTVQYVPDLEESHDWLEALVDSSLKIRSSIASYLLGILLGNSLLAHHKTQALKCMNSFNPVTVRELSVLDNISIGFYSRLGLWRFLGLFTVFAPYLERHSFWNLFTFMYDKSELSSDSLILSNLLGICGKKSDFIRDPDFLLFFAKCCQFSTDHLINQIRTFLVQLKKSDISSYNSLINVVDEIKSKVSSKLLKSLSTLDNDTIIGTLSKEAELLNLGDNSFNLTSLLNTVFCSTPSNRQLAVKAIKIYNKKIDHYSVEKICKFVNRYSSYSAQYMLLHLLDIVPSSELIELKIHFLLKQSSFSEVREVAFNILKRKKCDFLSNYVIDISKFTHNIVNVAPHILEGEINAVILCFYFASPESIPIHFHKILSHGIELICNSDLSIKIFDGTLFGLVTLLNRILLEFGINVISSVNNAQIIVNFCQRIFNEVSSIVENNAPEGEDHDEFELDIENKSKTISHFGWKLSREVSFLLSSCCQYYESQSETLAVLHLLKEKLLKYRHKGAICGLVEPFSICFRHVYRIIDFSIVDEFAKNAIDEALINPSIDNARRSAGVPYLICAILSNIDEGHLDILMEYILVKDYKAFTDHSLIHYLNILKPICKDSLFAGIVARNMGRVLKVAMFSMSSKSWKVVNAASLLMGCLVQVITSEFTVKRKMKLFDANMINVHFPSVFNVLCEHEHIQEVLSMPLLLLFRHTLFDPLDEKQREIMHYIENLLRLTTQSRNFYIRALSSEVTRSNYFFYERVFNLDASCNSKHSHLIISRQVHMDYYLGNGLQKATVCNLSQEESHALIQQYPRNQALLCHISDHVYTMSEVVLKGIFKQFLNNTAPFVYRQMTANAFIKYIGNNRSVIISDPELLIFCRFLLVDDDESIRDSFLRSWSVLIGKPFKTWIDGLSALFSIVSELCYDLQHKLLSEFYYEKLLNEMILMNRNETNSNGIFSPEPYNYNENLPLEVHLARSIGIQFRIPERLKSYYDMRSENADISSSWVLLCIEEMI